GYDDLVRLYIGRNVPGARKNTTVDLYKAFEAIVRDEEDFREQLRQYQGLDENGRPRVRPIDVPPLVFQSLPWLSPTGRNKMFNARLTSKGEGGKVRDYFQQPKRDPEVNEKHFAAVEPLLDVATTNGTFFHVLDSSDPSELRFSRWNGRYGIVDAELLSKVLRQFEWAKNYSFGPTLEFIDRAVVEGTLEDWAVIVPELSATSGQVATRYVEGQRLDVLKRTRRSERDEMFSGSSPRQRHALEVVSGASAAGIGDRPAQVRSVLATDEFRHIRENLVSARGTRGAMLLTFAADDGLGTLPNDLPDPTPSRDVATLFSLALPYKSAPSGRIAFTVRYQDGRATYEIEPGGTA